MGEKKKMDKVTVKILEGLREKIVKEMIDTKITTGKRDSSALHALSEDRRIPYQ